MTSEPRKILFERMIGPPVVGLWQRVHDSEWVAYDAVRREDALLAGDGDPAACRRAYLATVKAGDGDYWFARQTAALLARAIENRTLRVLRRA